MDVLVPITPMRDLERKALRLFVSCIQQDTADLMDMSFGIATECAPPVEKQASAGSRIRLAELLAASPALGDLLFDDIQNTGPLAGDATVLQVVHKALVHYLQNHIWEAVGERLNADEEEMWAIEQAQRKADSARQAMGERVQDPAPEAIPPIAVESSDFEKFEENSHEN